MTNTTHMLVCALVATLVPRALAQVIITVSTDAGGSRQLELPPESAFGSFESAETFVLLDGIQVQLTVVNCALAERQLTTIATVLNFSGQNREVEVTITQASLGTSLTWPGLVRSTAAAIATVPHGGGLIGPVAGEPLVRVRFNNSDVATAIPAPFGFSSLTSTASAIGLDNDMTESLFDVGLGDLDQVIAFSLTSGAAMSVTTHARIRQAGTPDVNGDGLVDGADLGALLNAWGPVTPWAPGDLDGNGVVNGADLGTLLNAFGMVLGCP